MAKPSAEPVTTTMACSPTTEATNALVYAYLRRAHPHVAALFKVAAGPLNKAARCEAFGDEATLQSVIMSASSAKGKTRSSQDDSDTDEMVVVKPLKTQVPHAHRAGKHGRHDKQDGRDADEGDQDGGFNPKQARYQDNVQRRFQRIDPSKVVYHHSALKDNSPGEQAMVLRQNQEMMRVKGKSFNKLKQKNKGKLYAAGVDLAVRSFQFEDSD